MGIKNKVRAVFRLFRLDLSLAAGICIVAGEILAVGSHISFYEVILGFLVGFFISSSALILNDYFDIESDKINAPTRPLPSGDVSLGEVLILTVITTLIGLTAASLVSVAAFFVAILLWVIGFSYNYALKETGVFGNVMVAISVAATFIYGGIIVGEPWNEIVWSFALIVFLIDLGEEIASDAMDVKGDIKRSSKSIAIIKGKGFALRVSTVLFSLVVAISFIPLVFGWFGLTYFLFIIPMDTIIIFSSIKVLRSKTIEESRRYLRLIYIGATISLIAFITGQIIT